MIRLFRVLFQGQEEESSLYAFLGRIRLNIALDALKLVRCLARSADHDRITHNMLNDAVFAHHRRTVFADKTNATLLRTYKPPLDDQVSLSLHIIKQGGCRVCLSVRDKLEKYLTNFHTVFNNRKSDP